MITVDKLLENYAIRKDCLQDKANLTILNVEMNLSGPDIAELLNVSITVIQRAFKKHGMSIKRNGSKTKGTCRVSSDILDSRELLNKLHTIDKLSVSAIADLVDVNRQTVKKRLVYYGIDVIRHDDDIKSKREITMAKRFGRSNAAHVDLLMEKRSKTNEAKYQVKYVGGTQLSSDVQGLLDDPNWIKEQHITLKKSLIQISNELGVCDNTVAKYARLHQVEICTYQTSSGENEIIDYIRTELNTDCDQSVKTLIQPYEIDIHIKEHNIAIEYCGLYWHADKHQRIDRHYHSRKFSLCKNQGIELITIFEDEWKQNKDIVKSIIAAKLGKIQNTIYARKCIVKLIDNKTCNDFLYANHLQGKTNASISIGLFYKKEIVSVACFKKRTELEYELSRFANILNVRVIGGFSKLVAKFWKEATDVLTLISFSDNRWSTGKLYIVNDFSIVRHLVPDYYYSPDGNNRYHKFLYRRKFLKRKLKQFDPDISEWENCKKNNILRIWDCGKIKFKLERTIKCQ